MMDRKCADAVSSGEQGGKILARCSPWASGNPDKEKPLGRRIARGWCRKEDGRRVRKSILCDARLSDAGGRRGEKVVVTSRAKTPTTAVTEPPIHQRSSCCRRTRKIQIQRLLHVGGMVSGWLNRCRRGSRASWGRWAIEIGSGVGGFVDDDGVRTGEREEAPVLSWVVGNVWVGRLAQNSAQCVSRSSVTDPLPSVSPHRNQSGLTISSFLASRFSRPAALRECIARSDFAGRA